nr:LINE-type retrotransposon LIb DNA [Ipomoea batatas]
MQVEETQVPPPIAKHGAWMIVNRKSKGSERGPAKSTDKKRWDSNHNLTIHSNGTNTARRVGCTVDSGRAAVNAATQVPTTTKHAGKGKQVDTIPVANTFAYLQDLENLQETPVLLEADTVSRGASKSRNHRKNNKGKKQTMVTQGTSSAVTGIFSNGTSAVDQLFVFGNTTGAPPNPPSGTMGVRYSWYKHEGGRTVLRKKLDRVFWNLDAQTTFPEAKSAILPRTHSDHHPIKFIGIAGRPPRKENIPFRFEGAWLRREDYKTLWNNVWNDLNLDLLSTITEVTSQSKEWNKNVFGNIFKRKANLKARLKGVQESVYYPTSKGLQDILPSEEVDKIRAIPIPLDEQGPDALYWPNSPGGAFSVREAYRYIAGGESTDEVDWVWKLKISERCRTFLWLTAKDKLLTNEAQTRRQLTDDSSCMACGNPCEDACHIFKHCDIARVCWRISQTLNAFHHGASPTFSHWLHQNCSSVDIINGRQKTQASPPLPSLVSPLTAHHRHTKTSQPLLSASRRSTTVLTTTTASFAADRFNSRQSTNRPRCRDRHRSTSDSQTDGEMKEEQAPLELLKEASMEMRF